MPATNRCLTKYCRNRNQRGQYCYKCSQRKWRENNPLHDAFLNLRHSAKRRGIPFSISLGYFSAFAARYDYLNHRGKTAQSFTVNRIDSTKGYVEGNIEMITNAANVAQGNRERALDHVWRKLQGCKINPNPDNEPF